MKILIIMPRQVGDVILTTPFLKVLFQHHVDWLSHPMNFCVLMGQKNLKTLYFYPDPKKTSWWKSLILNVKLCVTLKRAKYDVVIDVMHNHRTALYTFITSAPLRRSFRKKRWTSCLYNSLIDRELLNSSYLGLARLQLIPDHLKNLAQSGFDLTTPVFPQHGHVHEDVQNWIQSQSSPVIAIFPYSRKAIKRWPEKSFQILAKKLRAADYRILWLWGGGLELQCVQRLFDPQKDFMIPSLNLLDIYQVLKLCFAYVGVTSGFSHIAVAAQIKTVDIFGPCDPKSWTHPNQKRHLAIQRLEGCVSCGKKICAIQTRECLEMLDPEDVFQRVITHLQHT